MAHQVRRSLVGATVAAALTLALPALASATTFCVHSPASCTGTTPSPDTVQQAVNDAAALGGRDEIRIGVGSFGETVNVGLGNEVDIVGAGSGATGGTELFLSNATADVSVSEPSSTLRAIRIRRPALTGVNALQLAGTADDVSVLMDPGGSGGGAVVMYGTSTFRNGSVTWPDGDGIDPFTGTGMLIEDTRIVAQTGVYAQAPTTVRRTSVKSSFSGIFANDANLTVDSSLVELVIGGGVGILSKSSGASRSITARGVTIVGDDTPGQRGLMADPGPGAVAASVVATGVVVRNVAGDHLVRDAFFSGAANITISYSDYDFAKKTDNGPGTLTEGEGRLNNVDPLFVDPGGGDYRLAAGSPLVDAGEPAALAAGESTTDAAKAPRLRNARDACVDPRRDIGAFEYQPGQRTPRAVASAAPASAEAAAPVTFAASGSCDPDGDPLSFAWRFDDGATASGPSVQHAFASPGAHSGTLTVSDGGRSASATAAVQILDRLIIEPPPDPVPPAGCPARLLVGNPAANTLTGTSLAETLFGLAGNDKIVGASGDDCLLGGTGNDGLSGVAGKDRLFGEAGTDKLSGGTANDRLDGGTGDDTLDGGAGNDSLTGGTGNDKLSGASGKNTYSAGAGNDTVNSFNKRIERVNCGSGRKDKVRADPRDKLRGCERVTRVRLIRR